MKQCLPLLLLLAACRSEPEFSSRKLEEVIQKQMRTGPKQRTAFLTLKYGDSRETVAAKLAALKEAGTVENLRLSTESDVEWPNAAGGYRFTTPSELKAVDWLISASYHNDSLVQVNLTAVMVGDPAPAYQALRAKYAQVYGAPAAATSAKEVFVRGTQRVDIGKEKNYLDVTYQNTAIERRLLRHISSFYFGKDASSYDSAYYRRVVVPRIPKNPDHI